LSRFTKKIFNNKKFVISLSCGFDLNTPMASIISGMSRSSSSTDVEAQASARKAKRRRIQNKPEGLDDTRISHLGPLLPPCCLLEQLPLTAPIAEVVHNGRAQVASIVNGLDDRLVCIVGPCSVHDIKAAKEYATVSFFSILNSRLKLFLKKPTFY
jgi:hypothetical protein